MTQNINNSDTQYIIKNYTIIYRAFFVFGSFFIALVLSIGGWYVISAQVHDTYVVDNIDSADDSVVIGLLPSVSSGFTIYAYQNTNIVLDNTIKSDWNLVQYEGYTLPAHNHGAVIDSLSDASTFNNPDYGISLLKNSVATIIFQDNKTDIPTPFQLLGPIPYVDNQSMDIVSQQSIGQSFRLDCLYDRWKISNIVCEKYITSAIQDIFSYDISRYHQELVTIGNIIPLQSHELFCDSLVGYLRNTGDYSSVRDSIVASLCTPTQRDVYQKTVSLIQANKDLISQKSINGVGDNEIMNEYIIHSLLQDIYNDIKSGAINPLIIKQYVESWNKIFREQYTVSSFTYDASYYLNQTLILPALNNTTLTNRLERSEINTLQADIKKLNDGGGNTSGLYMYITNQSLKDEVNVSSITDIATGVAKDDILYGNYFQEISRVNVNNTIRIQGELRVMEGEIIPISITIDSDGAIAAVSLPYGNEREDTINNLIQTKKLTGLYEIETFVVNNLDAIQSATINTCDILTEYIGSKLVSCDSTTIIIQDTKNEVSIRYEITINDAMKITKFKTNSTHMQERIREEITDLNTNSSTLIPTIVAITNVSWESAQSDSLEHQVGIADKFIVIDRIKRYMGIEPDNIGQRGDEFVVGVTIADKLFYASYDLASHSLTNIILPDITIDGKRVLVSEFVLTLSDEYQNDINQFMNDPITFIKRRYPSVNTLYQNRD